MEPNLSDTQLPMDSTKSMGFNNISPWIMGVAVRFKTLILVVAALSILSAWAIPRLDIQNDLMFMIPDGNAVKEAYFDAEEHFGNPGGIAIAIGSDNGIYQSELLERVQAFSTHCRQLNLRIPAQILASQLNLTQERALALTGLLQSLSTDPQFTAGQLAELMRDPEGLSEAITDALPAFVLPDDPDALARELAESLAKKAGSDPGLAETLFSFAKKPTDRRRRLTSTWVEDVVSITEADTVWPEFTDRTAIIAAMAEFDIPSSPDSIRFTDGLLEAGLMKADAIFAHKETRLKPGLFSEQFLTLMERKFTPAAAKALENAMKQAPKQIRVARLVPGRITREGMADIRERLHAWPFFERGLYSKDEKSLLVVLRTAPNLDQENRERLLSAVTAQLETAFGDGRYTLHLAGHAVVDQAVGTRLLKDVLRLFPLVTLVVVIFLGLSFRSLAGVLYPLLTVLLAVAWCLGAMSLLHVPLSLVAIALPVLLVAVGSAYGIHLIHYYSFHYSGTARRFQGVAATLEGTGRGVIMAGLTTIAGFASLAFNDIVPLRDFGIFTALGVLFSLLISLVLIPSLLARFGVPPHSSKAPGSEKSDNRTGIRLLGNASSLVTQNPKKVLAVLGLVLAVCSLYFQEVRVEMNNISFFKKTSDIRRADTFINEKFAGTVDIRLVFSSDQDNGILSPIVFETMAALEQAMEKNHPQVGKTLSILDLIRKMNQAFYFNDPLRYRIPLAGDLAGEQSTAALKAHLASYIDKYRRSDTRPFIDAAKRSAVMTFQVKTASSTITRQVADSVGKILSGPLGEALDKENISVRTTGTGALYLEAEQLILRGQLLSVAISLVIVLVLVAVVMQSVVYGLLAVLPLGLALFVNFGIMGFLDIPLDAATAITACVAIGIGIDYGLHYLNRYRLFRALGKDHTDAAMLTTQTTGGPILINAFAVAGGFLVLVLSAFVPLVNLGILIATTMLTSAAGALTLLPAALTHTDKYLPKE